VRYSREGRERSTGRSERSRKGRESRGEIKGGASTRKRGKRRGRRKGKKEGEEGSL